MARYDWLDGFLLALPGCEKDYKAEWDWFRYRVCGKMFAATCVPDAKHGDYGGKSLLTLKCEPLGGELLRESYPDILPGFYMDKRCWISVDLGGDVPDGVLRDLCVRSHALVCDKLTKKQRAELETTRVPQDGRPAAEER